MTWPAEGTDGKVLSLMAVDPETGDWSTVIDGCERGARISRDGRSVAFVRDRGLWVAGLPGVGVEPPRRVAELESTSGSPPVWSNDGRRLLISQGKHGEGEDSRWEFATIGVGIDGRDRAAIDLPVEDGVQDATADGSRLLVATSRNAAIGWQLDVTGPDGRKPVRVTEGGNPFYARFAPDGRSLLYTDGTTEARRGIWVVAADGSNRRRVLPQSPHVSACFAPDGLRIAAWAWDREATGIRSRLLIAGLDGVITRTIHLPSNAAGDMPDWR